MQTIWISSPWAPLHTTFNTSSNPPLPHTCNSDEWRRGVPGLPEVEKEKKHQAQMVSHQPVWNPVLTSWPHFHKDIQQITGIVRNPFMLLFLTDRQQLVKLGKYTSNTCKISTGAPQGCILSPLHFSLYTTDCTSKDLSVELLKFADDTTLIGLIQDGEDSAYRQEVKELAVWCSLTTWSGTRSKQWRWSWTSGDPPCSSPTYHHERHCDCSGVIQIPGHHHLPGPEVGQS